MRTVHTDKIKTAIKEMCIEANLMLSRDVEERICVTTDAEIVLDGQRIS